MPFLRVKPPYYERVIEMYHQGSPAREIAAEIGKSRDAVSSLIKRMNDYGETDSRVARVARKAKLLALNPAKHINPSHWSRDNLGDGQPGMDTSKRPRLDWAKQDALYAKHGSYAGEDIVEGDYHVIRTHLADHDMTLTGGTL